MPTDLLSPLPARLLPDLRRLSRLHGRLWFHGNDHPSQPFQHDPQHPGLWLADHPLAAAWYAQHPLRGGQLHVFSGQDVRPLPCLSNPQVRRELCRQANLPLSNVTRDHLRGTLYLTHQRAVCDAAQHLGFAGLILRDHTVLPHHSAVLWTARPAPLLSLALPLEERRDALSSGLRHSPFLPV